MVDSMFTAAHEELVAAVLALRARAGLTQRELAAALGREQSFVGRIETGQRRIDLVEWVSICRACGADPGPETARLVARIAEMIPKRRRATKTGGRSAAP